MRYIFRRAAASRYVLVTVRGERAWVVHFTFHILRRTAGGRRLGNVAEGPHSFRIKQRRRSRRSRRRCSSCRLVVVAVVVAAVDRMRESPAAPTTEHVVPWAKYLSPFATATAARHIPITINHPPTLGRYTASSRKTGSDVMWGGDK